MHVTLSRKAYIILLYFNIKSGTTIISYFVKSTLHTCVHTIILLYFFILHEQTSREKEQEKIQFGSGVPVIIYSAY